MPRYACISAHPASLPRDVCRVSSTVATSRTGPWIDVGANDPFRAADAAFARAHRARFHVWPGGHDGAYWQTHLGAYLAFYVRSCA